MGKKLKARDGIALAIKAQRRAVENHEVETTDRLFLCLTRKRVEDSNLPCGSYDKLEYY